MSHTESAEDTRTISKSFLKFTAGCIDAAASLGLLFTFAGFFGHFHWIPDLFSQGREALALCFLGFMIYKLICRNYKTAALSLIPLDHCFHSKDVIITSRKRGANIGSDHFPLIIDAEF